MSNNTASVLGKDEIGPNDSWAEASSPSVVGGSSAAKKPSSTDAIANKLEDTSLASKKREEGLISSTKEVKVTVSDHTIQLRSASTWSEMHLPEAILKGVAGMRWERPSKIQEKVLPLLIHEDGKGANVIVQSQAGTGKTGCFSIALIHYILKRGNLADKNVQAVCVCPSMEIAEQIEDTINTIAADAGIVVLRTVAGFKVARGKKVEAHILVSTPGRAVDLFSNKLFDPSKVGMFVLDEADDPNQICGAGKRETEIMRMMSSFDRAKCRFLLFSATFPPDVLENARKLLPNPVAEVTLPKEELMLQNITQCYVLVNDQKDKLKFLTELYLKLPSNQSIVFVNKRRDAQDVAMEIQKSLQDLRFPVKVVHGMAKRGQVARPGEVLMTPEERQRIVDEFREQKLRVLISTDALARGFDVLTVSMVINFDLPVQHENANEIDATTYVHRIGRCGRFGNAGLAINLVTPAEEQLLQKIEKDHDFRKHGATIMKWDRDAQEVKDNFEAIVAHRKQ